MAEILYPCEDCEPQPARAFQRHGRDGSLFKVCKKCMGKRQKKGYQKRKDRVSAFLERTNDEEGTNMALQPKNADTVELEHLINKAKKYRDEWKMPLDPKATGANLVLAVMGEFSLRLGRFAFPAKLGGPEEKLPNLSVERSAPQVDVTELSRVLLGTTKDGIDKLSVEQQRQYAMLSKIVSIAERIEAQHRPSALHPPSTTIDNILSAIGNLQIEVKQNSKLINYGNGEAEKAFKEAISANIRASHAIAGGEDMESELIVKCARLEGENAALTKMIDRLLGGGIPIRGTVG